MLKLFTYLPIVRIANHARRSCYVCYLSCSPESISLDEFRHGMRRLTAGVSLVTTSSSEEKFGLIATSVSSLAAEPPSLLVCVNRSASSHDAILQAGYFAVNVLREQHDDLCAQFSSPTRRAERFQSGEWQTLTGAPVLADALVSFDCQLEKRWSGTPTACCWRVSWVLRCRAKRQRRWSLQQRFSLAGLSHGAARRAAALLNVSGKFAGFVKAQTRQARMQLAGFAIAEVDQ